LFSELIAVYCENNTTRANKTARANTLCEQDAAFRVL